MHRYRVTVDTGGTFSDFVYLNEDTGEVSISKVPSTPDDPSRAILQGVETLLGKGVAAGDISFFCHGTTVGTNALLEGKGVRTGLLVTEGFRGVYPVGEQARPYGAPIFDVMFDKPPMLVPQSLHRRGARARRFPRQGARAARRGGAARHRARAEGRERSSRSRCACCSRSCIREHEARVREIVAEEMPDCSISLSSDDRAADPRVSPAVRRPSSTPICSRSWRATSRSSRSGSTAPA